MDPNEYFVAIHEPRHYPNGPSLPLEGPIPEDHPVVAAARESRSYKIRVHRDRFVEGRRFLHAEVAAGRVDAVTHWWYGGYCEMGRETVCALLETLEVDLDRLPGTPHAETVSAAVSDYLGRLERGDCKVIRAGLGKMNSDLNPYIPHVLYGNSGEDALRHFTGERYVPPIPHRRNGMRI
jgi:hypothetical protein